MTPIAVSLVAFAIILAGAFAGTLLRWALPGHHLADDAKDIIRLGAGLTGTIAALVLGLLIASAKSSYDTQSGQVQHLTADVVLLDQLLAQYGPEAHAAGSRSPGRPALAGERHGGKGCAVCGDCSFRGGVRKNRRAYPANGRPTLVEGAGDPGFDRSRADPLGALRPGRQFDPHA